MIAKIILSSNIYTNIILYFYLLLFSQLVIGSVDMLYKTSAFENR